jgi:hypothetical protein
MREGSMPFRLLRKRILNSLETIALAVAVFVLCGFSSAHFAAARGLSPTAMTPVQVEDTSPCVIGGETEQIMLYSAQGPSNEIWAVDLEFGLINGPSNNVADSAFLFILSEDYSPDFEVGSFGDVNDNWISQGYVEEGTITVSLSGEFNLLLEVTNAGSSSQCYNAAAEAYYVA